MKGLTADFSLGRAAAVSGGLLGKKRTRVSS